MNPNSFIKNALNPALAMLPANMDTPSARTIMLAIAFQESGLKYRHQIGGPAHGYFMFEQGGGVHGVLTHRLSKPQIQAVLMMMDYSANSTAAECYAAIEHNDILACVFARLLLWTDPKNLPDTAQESLDLYLRTWRPGKPHPKVWPDNYARAVELIGG